MNQQQKTHWQTILDITQQMRELAVPNESLTDLSIDEEYARQPWHAISELERERLHLLKDFFSVNVPRADAEEIAAGIRKIQNTDQALFLISQKVQKEISGTFSKMGHSQRAASAYSSNQQHQK